MERVTLKLTKLEVAEIQLNRAIKLFLTGDDYVSAITLAGASEEILGKLLKQRGLANALEELVERSRRVQTERDGEAGEKKTYVSLVNYFRDRLKHISDGAGLLFSVDYEAAILIERAMSNYVRLTGRESADMAAFRESGYFS
jgi:hypothetical protein